MGALPSQETSQRLDSPPAAVTINVYDIFLSDGGQVANSILRAMGTGAFHCGVEVYGREWSFRATCQFHTDTGLFSCPPKKCQGHVWRESVPMGMTFLYKMEVVSLLRNLAKQYTIESYDLLRNNCCHFSDRFCQSLNVGPIPYWTTNLAGAGAVMSEAASCAGMACGSRRSNMRVSSRNSLPRAPPPAPPPGCSPRSFWAGASTVGSEPVFAAPRRSRARAASAPSIFCALTGFGNDVDEHECSGAPRRPYQAHSNAVGGKAAYPDGVVSSDFVAVDCFN